MITVCEKGKCTGCMECIDICPKNAIKVIDSLIEYNAIIDPEQCIQCNACHNACQNNTNETHLLETRMGARRCCSYALFIWRNSGSNRTGVY